MAASLGNATVNVLARTVLFEQSLRRSLKRMSILTAAVFAGVGAANFFGGAVKDSIALERQVLRIKTLLDTPAEKGLFSNESVRQLSNEIGLAADKTAESLFYLLSSGIKAADAMDVLTQSSKTAVAQNADLTKVADFASSALNAYGGQLDRMTGKTIDAQAANDILNRALDKGKGTMNDFAKYISSAIPIADSLGISLSEVASAGATSTLTGMSARKAFTGLKVAMQELNDPTKGLGEAFKDLTGKTFRDFIAQGGTLEQGFKKLGKAIGAANITTVAGAKEGGAAIQQLLQLWPQYQDTLEAVGNSAGVTASKFDTVDKSMSRQLERIKVQLTNFRGSVGDWLGPVLSDALDGLRSFWPKLQQALGSIVSGIGMAFSQIGAALGPAFEQIQFAFGQIDWGQIVSIIKDVVDGILIGFAPLAAAIAGVIYLFAGLATYIQPIINLLANMSPVIVGLTAAWAAYKTVLLLTFAVQKAQLALQKLQVIWTTAVTAAQIIQIGVTGGLAGAWTALTLIMAANPIGAVIALVAGLAAALIFAWKKSETFRNIVKKSFNAVVVAVGAAIKFVINIGEKWVTSYLEFFQHILKGLGKLPKWLGGGKFDQAAAAMGALIDTVRQGVNAINSEIDRITDKIQVEITLSLSDTFNADKVGQMSAQMNEAQADKMYQMANKSAADAARKVISKTNTTTSGGAVDFGGSDFSGGGGGGGGDGGKAAASEAAKKIKAALNRVIADANRIAKNTSKQSIDTLKTNFKSLYTDLGEAGKKNLIPIYKKVEKQLLKLASKRDGLEEKLDVAKEKFNELTDASKALTDQIKSQVNAMGNVADESKGLGTTYTGIRNQLRGAIAQTKQFTDWVNKLRKMNLNATSLRQIIDAGPEAGAAAAKALVQAGQKGVDEIDKLQSQLNTAGGKLATAANDEFFKRGIQIAQGLVKGLESQHAAISKQMDKIADQMVNSIKKKLKIKSPSLVFNEIGQQISQGLANGIEAKGGGARTAMSNVTNDIKVAVHGVSDPFAAHRAGILSGEGIANVLDRRRTAAALSQ